MAGRITRYSLMSACGCVDTGADSLLSVEVVVVNDALVLLLEPA